MGRHRKTRRELKKQRKIIVISLIAFLFIMVGGYAAFQTNLNITAKGNINPRNSLYVSSLGSDETGRGTQARPYKTLAKAYNSAAAEATIYVMDNLTIDETVIFDQNKKITLTSETNEINSLLRGKEDEMLLKISSGETTFTNITIDGQNKEANYALLRGGNKAIINLNMGTTIQNNIDNIDAGGGVSINRSTMTINGAKIINNKALAAGGGGIITNYATLTINSGEISNNYSVGSGGGIFFGGSGDLLTMNGGLITKNETTQGGGISLASTNMVMNGGEISENIANYSGGGGIALGRFFYNQSVPSSFIFKKGEIKNNTATPYGGGIYLTNTISTYTNEGGNVFDNTPDDVYKANS